MLRWEPTAVLNDGIGCPDCVAPKGLIRASPGTARQLSAVAPDAAEPVIEDISNRNIRVAVTGLSRSGKTVFTTSLIHKLPHAAERPRLLPALKVG